MTPAPPSATTSPATVTGPTGTPPMGSHGEHGTEAINFERSPLDVLRLLAYAAVAIVVVLATRYLPESTTGVEADVASLLAVNATALRNTLDVILAAGTFIASLGVLLIPLLTKRWRVFGYVLSADILAGVAIAAINAWVGDLDHAAGFSQAGTVALDVSTDVASSTQVVASFVAIAPFVSRRWRRIGLWTVAALTVLRLAVASGQPTHVLMVLTVGAAIGAGVLLAFGRPSTQPSTAGIIGALHTSGLRVTSIRRASVDARGSVPWFAELADGSQVFVKVLGADQRAADLLFRVYRMFRLRNVGDERPFSSLRRAVEHEALLALVARDVGVRTPRMRAVSAVGNDSFLLAYERIEGTSLDAVDPAELTDDVLAGIWEQVATMRRHRIAHRDLRLANMFLASAAADQPRMPWVIDFGFSEVAADEVLLRADLAQLLASLAIVVGPGRAVAGAGEAIGTEALAGALTRLQPAALSSSTQSELKARPGLLDELRGEIEAACGVGEPQLEPVARFGVEQVLTLVVTVAVVYFLLPQLADLSGVIGEIGSADWWWVIPALLATAATFLAAGASITGSVPQPLPTGVTLVAQVASSFAGKVAPAGLGGISLNVRYLERQGIDGDTATSAVGLNAVAGTIGHASLMLLFILRATRHSGDVPLPSPEALVIGIGVALLIGGAAVALPATRRLMTTRLVPILLASGRGLRELSTSPTKLILLLGGSTLVTAASGVAFYFSASVFGVQESFATLMAVYLVGTAIAAAAPTPGGLGAVEAVLIGGLIAVGVDGDLAVPTVFLYRGVTFWLPMLPGWAALTWLRRTERL